MKKYYEAIEGGGGQIDWQKEISQLQSQVKKLQQGIKNAIDVKDEYKTECEYLKARCELSEKMYKLLNSDIDHQKEYAEWQALKNQTPIT